MSETRTALVAGANGIIGKALMETLASAPGWRARALSRRPHGSPGAVAVDLTDAAATRAALAEARDVTHLF
ncbi:NAD-dependent epimerase, partial [Methylobacterium frigidaeris]